MNKIVIGLSGEIAAGKGTAAEYLRKNQGASYIKLSQPGRDILVRLYKEINRQNMNGINMAMRTLFGEGYLADVIIKDIEKIDAELFVLDGIRKIDEVKKFRQQEGINFILVYVVADDIIRYERLIKRTENADDKNKSFEQFKKDLKLENEVEIKELKNIADFVVDNSTSKEGLYSQIDEIIKGLDVA